MQVRIRFPHSLLTTSKYGNLHFLFLPSFPRTTSKMSWSRPLAQSLPSRGHPLGAQTFDENSFARVFHL